MSEKVETIIDELNPFKFKCFRCGKYNPIILKYYYQDLPTCESCMYFIYSYEEARKNADEKVRKLNE